MVGKGSGKGGWQKVGFYEDGWQGAWVRWLAKGWGFMRMVGKGLGERGWQKGGVYEDGWQWLGEGGLQKGGVYEVVVCENKGRMASNG